MKISIKLVENKNEFIANCPELDINSYGSSRSDAVRRLISVLKFYIETARELGLEVEQLDKIVIDGEKDYGLIDNNGFLEKNDSIN